MNILMVGSYLPQIGGAERALHELCLNLSRDKKINVSLLCPSAKGAEEEEHFHVVRAWNLIDDPDKIEKVRLLEYLQNYSFILPAIVSGKKLVRDKNIDVIHAHFGLAYGLIGLILKRICSVPLVLTLHGGGFNFEGKRRLLRGLVKKVLDNSDGIIAVSDSMKEKAEKLTKKEIKVIHNSVSTSDFKDLGKEYVLAVGRLVKLKNFDALVRAASDPRLKTTNFKLVGSGPEEENLRNLIEKLGLSNFELLGSLPHKEAVKVFSKCSIFCLSSKSEGLPLVVLEAMACEKPIIGTFVGGIPELVENGKNGFLFDVDDEKKLADLIYQLETHEKLRISFGKNSKKKILEDFNWDKNLKKIKQAYSEAIEK